MSDIKSNLNDALMHAGDIQTQSGKLSLSTTVSEAANTTVTVNSDCITAFSEGVSAFSNYEVQANEKASYIEEFGTLLNVIDHL